MSNLPICPRCGNEMAICDGQAFCLGPDCLSPDHTPPELGPVLTDADGARRLLLVSGICCATCHWWASERPGDADAARCLRSSPPLLLTEAWQLCPGYRGQERGAMSEEEVHCG